MTKSKAQFVFDDNNGFLCTGAWTVLELDSLMNQFRQFNLPHEKKIKISGEGMMAFDSAGALALRRCMAELSQRNNTVDLEHFTESQHELIDLIKEKEESVEYHIPPAEKKGLLYSLGRETVRKVDQIDGLVILIGDLFIKIFDAFAHWKRFQFPSIVSVIYTSGIGALPIVGLLSFLIGVVLAYQMGLQLETYGANIFIAYISGMAIFREFAPLITAIIVAGRTSSAFTAQLGSMKINEEIDALLTMGLSPTQLLVMPKVLGLLLVFPLLIFWSDIFSILGAMYVSKHMLNIGYVDFLHRLKDTVGLSQMMLGLYKAPVYAVLIALVGCFQGFKVQANASSIGSQTTKSVVQALFLIIIADAAYSVLYSWMGL